MERAALNAPIPRRVAGAAGNPRNDVQAGLRLENLALRKGAGLAGVTVSVPPGALLGVLGPGGSGKSALIDVLAGVIGGSGMAALDGADLLALPAHRRGLGVVRQGEVLFPQASLAQNIAYPLRLRGMTRRDVARLTEAAIDTVQLADAGRLPAQASAAERQRACWARATIFAPRLLLLDEPLSDQMTAEHGAMLAVLRRLHLMLGVTTVLATRVAGDALALADQVAVLHGGRLEQVDAPGTVYDAPVSARAARATGEANLLPGVVHAVDSEGMARVTLACGPVLEVMAAPGLKPRDACVLFLRPERIAVAPMAAADMGESALDATLIEALHLGDVVRLRLLLGTGAELLIKRPAAAGLRGLRPGQGVAIAWPESHAQVFPAR